MGTSATVRKRILIVEDEPGYQELLATLLKAREFALTICSSGEDALIRIDTQLFDLIITDINLQGITGIQVLEKVKDINRLKACPVVMCSSQFDPETKALVAELGAAAFISKPFDLEILILTVESLLEIKGESR